MNTVRRIARNMAFLFTARIIGLVLGFFYVMLTARYLGPNNYGILAFALALNGIFGVIANFGLDPLTVREVARNPDLAEKYLSNGITMKLLFGTFTFVIVAAVVNLLGYPPITRHVVYVITLSTIIAGVNNLFNDIYQAFEQMEFTSLGQVLKSAMLFILVLIGIELRFAVMYFAAMYLIANIIVLIYNVIVTLLKFLRPELKAELDFWREALREAWPFALTSIFVSIYYWIDSVMLSYMKGNEVVGWYNATYRLTILFLSIPTIFNLTIFPTMSRLYIQSRGNLKLVFEQYLRYMIILGIPLGVGVTMLARPIILLIYGSEYEPSAKSLQILIWSVVFLYMSSPPARTLEAIGRQSSITKMTAFGALLNISLNLLLIPRFSLYGASFTTALTEFYSLVVLFWLVTREGYAPNNTIISVFVKVSFSTALATVSVISLSKNLLMDSVLFGNIYLLLLVLTKVITKEEIKHLMEAIHL